MIVATGDLRLAGKGPVATGEGPVEPRRWNMQRFCAHFWGDEGEQYILRKLLSNGISIPIQLASLAIIRAKYSLRLRRRCKPSRLADFACQDGQPVATWAQRCCPPPLPALIRRTLS